MLNHQNQLEPGFSRGSPTSTPICLGESDCGEPYGSDGSGGLVGS
jgi:hypothetical protein